MIRHAPRNFADQTSAGGTVLVRVVSDAQVLLQREVQFSFSGNLHLLSFGGGAAHGAGSCACPGPARASSITPAATALRIIARPRLLAESLRPSAVPSIAAGLRHGRAPV